MRRLACLLLLAVFSCSAAYAAKDKDKDILVTVNGKSVKKEDVAGRIWNLFANDALNVIVDETLVEQAMTAWRSKAPQAEKDAAAKETDARLKRVQAQFKDEAAFGENLKKSGVTLEDLKKQIESGVIRESLVVTAKAITVSTAEAKEFFDANKDKLGQQESVHVRHILVNSEQQAKDLLIAIKVGADFAKLASEVSLDTGLRERGGDLGFIPRGMLVPDIEKVVFALKPGEVSDVVRSQLGWHIFKVEEAREAKAAVYSEIEKDLMAGILAQKINRAWPLYLKDLRAAAKIVPSAGVTYTPAPPQPMPQAQPAPANP